MGFSAHPSQYFLNLHYHRGCAARRSGADKDVARPQKRTAQLAPRPVETASEGSPAFVASVLQTALTCQALDWQDVGEMVAYRDLESSTALYNREDGGYAWPSPFATTRII